MTLDMIFARVQEMAYGFLSGVCKGVWVCIDNLALNLVGPATIVSQAASSHGHISSLCHTESLSVIERLYSSQKVYVLLEQIGKLDEESSSVLGCLLSPDCLVCLAGSSYCDIDILFCGLVDRADNFFGGGVDGLEGLSVNTLNELVVDEPGVNMLVLTRRKHDCCWLQRGKCIQ